MVVELMPDEVVEVDWVETADFGVSLVLLDKLVQLVMVEIGLVDLLEVVEVVEEFLGEQFLDLDMLLIPKMALVLHTLV